jgi:hypothetical protein
LQPSREQGRNVTVEYHYLQGGLDRLPALMTDLVRRRVAIIVTVGTQATIAAVAESNRPSLNVGCPVGDGKGDAKPLKVNGEEAVAEPRKEASPPLPGALIRPSARHRVPGAAP